MKKKTLLQIIAVIGFLVAAGTCITLTYNALRWKDTTGNYLSSVEQLRATDDDLVDVVFVGSSHCYCGITPSYFWNDKGWSVFDMATSGQDKDSGYYHLKNLLKTQSPKVVFVDLHALSFDKHGVEGNIYRNLLSLPFSDNSVKLVMDYAEKDKWADYIARFPVIHTRYKELTKYDFCKFAPNEYGRGEYLSWETGSASPPYGLINELIHYALPEKNKKWLDRMIELSEEEGYELVFIVLPFDQSDVYNAVDAGEAYVIDRGYEVIDFNRKRNDVGYDYNTDFIDYAHLNLYGARKTADYLENFIEERFSLEDHRGDEKYWQWDEDSKWYDNIWNEHRIQTSYNLAAYTQLLAEAEDMVSIVSLEGSYITDGYNYFEALETLGMTYTEYEQGGKWIYEDGKLEKVYDNVIDAPPYERDLGSNDTLRISYEGDYLYQNNVMIGKETYYNKDCYLCITVYNKMLERVVDSKVFW